MSCAYAHLDGSYVLGALAPAERREFEQHLSGCAACADAVRELAGLPGLLARVDPVVLEEADAEEAVPDTLLDSLVAEVRRTGQRRTRRAVGLAAAAVLVATTGAVAATDVLRPSAPPAATVATGTPMTKIGYVPMTARVALSSRAWGTELQLSCRYGPTQGSGTGAPGYALVVHTKDGRTEQVATWRAVPGRWMHLDAATSVPRGQIASVEVRLPDGTPVLRLRR